MTKISNWETYIEADFTRMLKIYILRETHEGTEQLASDLKTVYHINGGGPLGEPTMELHRDIIESLAKAASKVLPPTEATVEHLKDVIGIRDRLLTLVEKVVK